MGQGPSNHLDRLGGSLYIGRGVGAALKENSPTEEICKTNKEKGGGRLGEVTWSSKGKTL